MGMVSKWQSGCSPVDLFGLLQRGFGIRTFVEAGTYMGDTAKAASGMFERVFTIEYSREIFDLAHAGLAEFSKVEHRFGDSRVLLGEAVGRYGDSALYWLDSHWSGGSTYGEGDECPVLAEIRTIVDAPHAPYILIDDARLFLSPPPDFHRIDQWPDICELLDALRSGRHRMYITVVEDVIVAVPESARGILGPKLQAMNTAKWRRDVTSRA